MCAITGSAPWGTADTGVPKNEYNFFMQGRNNAKNPKNPNNPNNPDVLVWPRYQDVCVWWVFVGVRVHECCACVSALSERI